MKQVTVFISSIILIFVGVFIYFNNQKSIKSTVYHGQPTHSPSPTTSVGYCSPQDLDAAVHFSPGAGNVYGTFTLKNMSPHTCYLLGGSFISAHYDTSTVKNITITHVGQTQPAPFILSPNQTLYSQVHYPNGPQCQSVGLNNTAVLFTYQISSTDTVTFKNENGSTQQQIHTCTSPTDQTEIQIWNMSTSPITP